MRVLYIAWKDTLLRIRDPLALLFTIAAPLVIVLIIGVVFGQSRLEPATVLVVNLDQGQLGAIYANALTSDQVKDYVKTTSVNDEVAARAAVDRGDVAAAVIVPAGFTQAIFRGEKQQVEVYADSARIIGPEVVRAIVNTISFEIARNAATVQASLAMLLRTGRIDRQQQLASSRALGTLMQANTGRNSTLILRNEDVPASAGSAVLAYYAPAMLVFFLMLNAMGAGPHLLEEKTNKTLDRLLTTPVGRGTVIAGKLLGDVLLTGAQAAVLVAGLGLLFHVNLGDPLSTAALLAAFVLCTTSLGLVVAGLTRSTEAAGGATQAVAMMLGLAGGAFVRTDNIEVLSTLRVLAPNYWALDGLLKSVNGNVSDVVQPLAVLLGMTLVLAYVGARTLGPKLSEA
jgi:ABC-2 type transport system permease protein